MLDLRRAAAVDRPVRSSTTDTPRSLQPRPSSSLRWPCRSASDLKVVADVDDPDGYPRGVEDRVVFGPGTDMAGQRDDVVLGIRAHVTAVRDQRRAVQGLPDVQVDVDRVGSVGDIDVVLDVADADQAGRGRLGGGALCAVGYGPGSQVRTRGSGAGCLMYARACRRESCRWFPVLASEKDV